MTCWLELNSWTEHKISALPPLGTQGCQVMLQLIETSCGNLLTAENWKKQLYVVMQIWENLMWTGVATRETSTSQGETLCCQSSYERKKREGTFRRKRKNCWSVNCKMSETHTGWVKTAFLFACGCLIYSVYFKLSSLLLELHFVIRICCVNYRNIVQFTLALTYRELWFNPIIRLFLLVGIT